MSMAIKALKKRVSTDANPRKRAYAFDELDPEAQDKAVDGVVERFDPQDVDDMTDEFSTVLKDRGFGHDPKRIEWSFDPMRRGESYVRWSGEIDATRFWKKYGKEFKNPLVPETLFDDPQSAEDFLDRATFYYSGKTAEVEWDEYDESWDPTKEEVDLMKAVAEFMEDGARDTESDLLTMVEKEYEYLNSREVIVETIKANKWEFNKDGTFLR